MKNGTLYLPGFHLPTLRRKPRSEAQKLADEKVWIRRHTISQLGECFCSFIPLHELENAPGGHFSRRRIFSKSNTFWGFFTQVLDSDGGCQEVVRKVQAFSAARAMPEPSASTSAYCQARNKLDRGSMQRILQHTSEYLQERGRRRWWKDRRVVVVDGTGVSMPDTALNQEAWPQPGSQKPGCGFPQARICACFCLQTGALLSHRVSQLKDGELTLRLRHWQPVLTTYRMALTPARRPRCTGRHRRVVRANFSAGSSTAHCSSVISLGYMKPSANHSVALDSLTNF